MWMVVANRVNNYARALITSISSLVIVELDYK